MDKEEVKSTRGASGWSGATLVPSLAETPQAMEREHERRRQTRRMVVNEGGRPIPLVAADGAHGAANAGRKVHTMRRLYGVLPVDPPAMYTVQ